MSAALSRPTLLAYGLPGLPLAVVLLPLFVYLPTFYAENLGLGFTLVGSAGVQFYNTTWGDSTWLTAEADAPAIAVRNFLTFHGSCLDEPILDADGKMSDIPTLIQQAAAAYTLNPKLLLAIMEAEQQVLSTCPDQTALASLMGMEPASTARVQIAAAAAQLRTAITTLTNNGVTPNNWQTSTPKNTLDGVSVIPANNLVTLLFDYSQNAGTLWGGTSPDETGVQGIYAAWIAFNMDIPLPQSLNLQFIPGFR